MANGRTQLDEAIGPEAEDYVTKIHPTAGKSDPQTQKVDDDGSTSKLPSNISPFTLKGA